MHSHHVIQGTLALTGRVADRGGGAGFADSAHLSRTFRRMLGITAASLRVS